MNSFDMRLDVKPAPTQPSKPAPDKSVPKQDKDSDFRKELENTAQNQEKAPVQGSEKPTVPVEKPALQQPEENQVDMQNLAVMLNAMMMPLIVMPEQQQVATEELLGGENNLLEVMTPLTQGKQVLQPIKQQSDVPVQAQKEQSNPEQVSQFQVQTGKNAAEGQKNTSMQQNMQTQQQNVAAKVQQTTVPKMENNNQQSFQAEVQVGAQPAVQPLFHDVKATPIKVAEPVRADVPEFPSYLAQKIDQAIVKGENTIQVQLAPRELGEITIRLSMTAEGTIVTLHSTNPKTLSLLTEHAANIGAIVEQNQHTNVSVQVEHDQPNAQQQQYTQQEHHGNGQQQQQQHERQHAPPQNDDFIQQFRLGLIELSAMQ